MLNPIYRFFHKLWRNLVAYIDKAPISAEEKNRLQQYTVFISLGIPTMAVYGLVHLNRSRYLLSGAIFASCAGLCVGWYLLRQLKNGRIVYRINAILFGFLIVAMVVIGGEGGSKILWMYIFPLIAFFLLGKIEGLLWTAGLGGLAMIIFWIPLPYVERYPYPSAFISRFLISYAIVTIITYWFEYFRDRYRQRMEAEQQQLTREKTRLKKAEQALRVNQQRFQEILKHSRDILYRRDLKTGRYDYISRAFGALLNYTEEEIDDMAYYGVENMIHADDRDRHRLFIEQLLTHKPGTAVADTIEYRMIDKNGASHWFSDRLAVVADTHGKAAFILGNNREITAQRKAEQAVRHAHSRFLTILDSIDAHVYVADLERYDILFMNRKMKKAFGDNTQKKKCWDHFRGGHGPCPNCSNATLLDADGEPTGVFEWEGQNPITLRWYINYDRTIKWIDDRWVRLQIAVDITRIKTLEHERQASDAIVRRAQKLEAIGTLAGGIAHDFNNLLSVIMGGVSLMDYELAADHESRVTLQQIEEASRKAKELANQLITFSKGGLPVMVPGSIGRLVFLSVQSAVGEANIRCQFKLDPGLWPVAFDESQIRRVMINIVGNAIDAMPDGGTIVITGSNHILGPDGSQTGLMLPEGPYVRLSVRDEGSGIPDSHLSQIFDPYFSTKGKGTDKGTGLGLAITHSIVTQHGGDIHVEPRNSAGGATFTIYLPACQQSL
jgi:PAS domain S-box-containing protein